MYRNSHDLYICYGVWNMLAKLVKFKDAAIVDMKSDKILFDFAKFIIAPAFYF